MGRLLSIWLTAWLLLGSVLASAAEAPANPELLKVVPPPESFFRKIRARDREAARKFYRKYLDVNGVPVAAADALELLRRYAAGERDFRRARLAEASLAGAILAEIDLRRACLAGADLSRARLGGADLSRANLTGASLRGADLRRTSLMRILLYLADLSGGRPARGESPRRGRLGRLPGGRNPVWGQPPQGDVLRLGPLPS